MFCPQCGIQNRLEQKFCRNCGLSLPSVQLAAIERQIHKAKAELFMSSQTLRLAWLLLLAWGIVPLLYIISPSRFSEAQLVRGMLFFGVFGLIGFGLCFYVIRRVERALKRLEGEEQEQGASSAVASYESAKRVESFWKALREGKEPEQGPGFTIASTDRSVSQAAPVSQSELSLPAVPDIDPILTQPAPGSITEHTTFELKRPEPR